MQQARDAAREALRFKDYEALVAAMRKAVEIKPDDPQMLLDLGSAELLNDDYPAAEARFRQIVGLPLGNEQRHIVSFAWLQLGRTYDVQGRRDEALEHYRRVLELPDVYGFHEAARQALEQPVTRESLH